jgi:hypothetical protein
MNPRLIQQRAMLLTLGLLGAAVPARADDGAAAVAAGGLVTRRETRIVMAKEVLKISPTKVVVDYDFRNDSDEDVTTEVAFPIPPYEDGPDDWPAKKSSFADFMLVIDGKPVSYRAEARAFLKKRDVTDILKKDKIDIATFGHYDWDKNRAPEFSRLPKQEQTRLVKLGLFDPDEQWGNWTVHLQYHWSQEFPAHSTIHIRHEYTPIVGFTQFSVHEIDAALRSGTPIEIPDDREDHRGLCMDRPFLQALHTSLTESLAQAKTTDDQDRAGTAYPHWVDFVLTTANTWKQPIEDFTLIVERPRPKDGLRMLVSFCSPEDAPTEKLDVDHFQVHLNNFIPRAELHIGFFDIPQDKPARPIPSK